MPTLDVVDTQKRKVGSVELREEVFGASPSSSLVHEAVVMQRASERQGTASTLRRGEVSGSGKKPWKQKHTGRARVGSIRSPLWRHGGTVFGPHPRNYAFSIPKKKYRAALKSALSAKVTAGQLIVVSALVLSQPKTRALTKILDQLGLTRTTLIIVGEPDTTLERASRNLRRVKLVKPDALSIYDVVRYDAIVVPERDLARLQEVWS